MLKTSDEILLLGSFDLITTEIFFRLDTYLWQYSPLFRFEKIIFGIQFFCLMYLICLIFADLKIFRQIVKGQDTLTYYLKSIGWIPYVYMVGIIYYLGSLAERDVSKLEDFFTMYPVSLILIALSLIIAWVRKHQHFFAE